MHLTSWKSFCLRITLWKPSSGKRIKTIWVQKWGKWRNSARHAAFALSSSADLSSLDLHPTTIGRWTAAHITLTINRLYLQWRLQSLPGRWFLRVQWHLLPTIKGQIERQFDIMSKRVTTHLTHCSLHLTRCSLRKALFNFHICKSILTTLDHIYNCSFAELSLIHIRLVALIYTTHIYCASCVSFAWPFWSCGRLWTSHSCL